MRVHVIATGGTIASTEREGGAAPTLDGDALVDTVPGLAGEVTVESVAAKPGFDMDPETVADVGDRARAIADDVAGVVVTHGTDTMEESAYYLDLTLPGVPVVFTGAQRRPDEVSADGPANLRTAVRAAAHERVSDGVYLAFNDELHAAREVTKAHTAALETFTSPESGPVARFTRSGVRWHREPRSETPALPEERTDATVPVVLSGFGVDARRRRGRGRRRRGRDGAGEHDERTRGGRRVRGRPGRRRLALLRRSDGAGVRDARREAVARRRGGAVRRRAPGLEGAAEARTRARRRRGPGRRGTVLLTARVRRSRVTFIRRPPRESDMRNEEEIREQYEFLKEELDDEDMRHEGVRQMFTYYKRALGWVLEEEYI